MLLGYVMLATGLTGMTIRDAVIPIFKYVKSRKASVKTVNVNPLEQLTTGYTALFENLGILDTSKGDWVQCSAFTRKKNYLLVKFKLSDTLSCEDFIKHKKKIEEKLLINYDGESYKNKIFIYNDKGLMHFRILNEKIELVPYEFRKTPKHLIPLGTDLDDNVVYWDLKKDPHIKIIGCTGSGKSRQQNIIINHIYHNIPGAPLWLMDFKEGIEFGAYEHTQNIASYADNLNDAPYVLQSIKEEYERRIKLIKESGQRCFDDYIAIKPNSKMKRGFLIIDEFADLMDLNDKKEGYDAIKELIDLGRKLRAAGLHIVLGTQRPTADSIPSSMKNNITGTVGMKTENEFNSRLIIDDVGCELLEQSQAIGKLESKYTFFRSFYIPDSVMEDTVNQFKKKDKAEVKASQKKPLKILK